MQRYDDYYMILQVHYLAEPEVIESAYRRLAKKYHPDVSKSKNSEEKMKIINQAYEVLSNPERRRQYDLERRKRYGKPYEENYSRKDGRQGYIKSFNTAKCVLDNYFKGIITNHFDRSYELISDADKETISRDDFIKWQKAVAAIFHIKEFSINICGSSSNNRIDGHVFSETAEFVVDIIEYNTIMDIAEKNTFTKMTVMENGKWRVYLGYESLQPMIDKFESLTGLLTAKTVIRELVESHSRIDSLTGILNKRGIMEKLENEILRYNRYGNVFSLAMCDIDIKKGNNSDMKHEAEAHAMKAAAEIFVSSLRKLDVVGRWGKKSFLILLPETRGTSAVEVAKKLYKALRKKKFTYKSKTLELSAKFKTMEYEPLLEKSLDKFYDQINVW